MNARKFVEMVAEIKLPSVFNPYSDVCPNYDLPNAPQLRRKNLESILEIAIAQNVEALWVARDLGYRGGRRTGVALTDEPNLELLSRAYGPSLTVQRATKGPPVAERTATVVWEMICRLRKPVFTWNVFPLHPHLPGEPFTNRCHTVSERAIVAPILEALFEVLKPKNVIAIGNEAKLGLQSLGVDCLKIRHPSYGGIAEFRSGVASNHFLRDSYAPPAQPMLI